MDLTSVLALLAASFVGATVAQDPGATPYWMDAIAHNGIASFNPDKSYTIFRNVKDYGAVGDGVTDDTAAINAAISAGNRCGGLTACVGSTTTPAVVYFPTGTYMISSSIVDYYYTQIIGDPRNMPTIKAMASFVPNIIGMLDGDVYVTGKLKYTSTNVFFRQLRNIRFDTTEVPGAVTAVHWPSAQATSIQNCVFVMSPDPGRQHTGIFMEEGSGGLLNDLVFYGGTYGCQLGNQQYTMRNMTFFNSNTAILQIWNWAWTYKSIYVYDCQIGINMTGPIIGSVTLLDSLFYNTPVGIISGRAPSNRTEPGAGSLIMENVAFRQVNVAVMGPQGAVVDSDASGTLVKKGFAYGNIYVPNGPNVYEAFNDAYFPELDELRLGIKYFERSKPQYDDVPVSSFLTARQFGAKGDGVTDDTVALNALFHEASNEFTDSVAFVDAGYYLVTDTIRIPPNVRIVGEALSSVIMGTGPKFQDMNAPYPVVQVGRPGEVGYVEWSDMIVSTQGPMAGAVLIEFNLETPVGPCTALNPPSGMWDVHVRVGGFAGSQLQLAQCGKTPQLTNYVNPACVAAYLGLHITRSASNVYLENNWIWTADHDIEDPLSSQISIFSGRGILVESEQGRIWMVATCAEHHVKYQYQLANTRNIWMGMIQTETPYYQPNPPAPAPFNPVNITIHDPDFDKDCNPAVVNSQGQLPGNPPCAMAWGLRIVNSQNVSVYGAGLYSFFNNYDTSCSAPGNGELCQARMVYTGVLASEVNNATVIGSPSSSLPASPSPSPSPAAIHSNSSSDVVGIEMYNLNTIGSVSMINRQGADVALYSDNIAGYTACVALFKF
ncbi:glucan 1,3-beta-glucosidase [Sporothrix schenckii 1099-18]|uniref:Glucan 1,3-beta-glucosidase n=1 Tax=Sporothrix schenckii 1099-18 TaxID=1397361 RepID=A0A0F2MD97_SPOSC|nr:glucan 1,3-beta-glucosidase [Sporothrix schenckii 1099-18]KJR86111.1 glucan 1,3-beta-glucosidase [Sporothrix schenckii 1099-18]